MVKHPAFNRLSESSSLSDPTNFNKEIIQMISHPDKWWVEALTVFSLADLFLLLLWCLS